MNHLGQEHNENLDAIEALIDKTSLKYVLDVIAEVASTKADHIRDNWQDAELAENWDNCCAGILTASHIAQKYLP